MIVKFLLSNGEYFREKVGGFPLAREFTLSGLLVVCTENDERVVAACGIRGLLNSLVLYVKEGYRGRRVGAQLLRKTIQAAEKRQLAFVTLSVSSANVVAFHLYSKCGFKEVLFLRKSSQILMMLPLTFRGKLVCAIFRMIGSLLPNTFLSYLHLWLYNRTL